MRTHNKHIRAFMNGVDVSGYTRAVGSLDWSFGAEPDAAVTDEVKNILIGQGDIQAGGYSAFLDNDAAGLFTLASAGTQTINYMVAIGTNAAPVATVDLRASSPEAVAIRAARAARKAQQDGRVSLTALEDKTKKVILIFL